MKQRAGRSVCEIPLMLRLPRAYFHQNLERISRPPFERKRTRTRAELELAGDPGPGFDGNWKRPFFPVSFSLAIRWVEGGYAGYLLVCGRV